MKTICTLEVYIYKLSKLKFKLSPFQCKYHDVFISEGTIYIYIYACSMNTLLHLV
jgi:hypothetical protein